MIAIMKTDRKEKPLKKADAAKYAIKDIIVKRVSYVEEHSKNCKTIKRQEKLFNITKKVNETAKALKIATALEKVEQLNQELLNKGVL